MIRAGTPDDIERPTGSWVIVDLGFSNKKASCGLAVDDADPVELTFADLQSAVLRLLQAGEGPMNLVLEAPLSAAFDATGNPTGRAPEKREQQTRYWYVGLGCSVLVAATYLLRAVVAANFQREIRLFEGMATFKQRGAKTAHKDDVAALREVIRSRGQVGGSIVPAEGLLVAPDHQLASAFAVSGMEFGVPAVIVADR